MKITLEIDSEINELHIKINKSGETNIINSGSISPVTDKIESRDSGDQIPKFDSISRVPSTKNQANIDYSTEDRDSNIEEGFGNNTF